MECRHIKSNGCKCKSPALHDKPYCYFHMRLHHTMHAAKAESAAAPGAALDATIEIPVMEDRTAVQFALTQVLQGLGARRLEPRRAGQLLYGLQIASQLLERNYGILPRDYVQSLTANEEGDELAPEKYDCDEDEDCNECPYVDKCTNWVANEGEDSDDNAADEDGEESETSDKNNDGENDDDKLVRKALALLSR